LVVSIDATAAAPPVNTTAREIIGGLDAARNISTFTRFVPRNITEITPDCVLPAGGSAQASVTDPGAGLGTGAGDGVGAGLGTTSDTWQVLSVPIAGSLPKVAIPHVAVPVMSFCIQRVSTP
jgi:hypothetical protein